MNKLLHKENINWKGKLHELELYEADKDKIESLYPVTQV